VVCFLWKADMKKIYLFIFSIIFCLSFSRMTCEASAKKLVHFDEMTKGVGNVVVTTSVDTAGSQFLDAVNPKMGNLNRAFTFDVVFSDYCGHIIKSFDEDKKMIIEIPSSYISPERDFKLIKCIDDIPVVIDDMDANAMTFSFVMNRPGTYMLCYEDEEMPDLIYR